MKNDSRPNSDLSNKFLTVIICLLKRESFDLDAPYFEVEHQA